MRFALLGFVALLAACATPYQDMTLGLGVRSTQVGADIYEIDANLNQLNGGGDLNNYLLMRAAEQALDDGAIGFVIVDSRDRSFTREYMLAGSAFTTGTANTFGDTTYYQGTTTYTPPRAVSEEHPQATIVIRLVRSADDPQAAKAYDAHLVVAQIGPQVHRGLGREHCGLLSCHPVH